MKRRTLLAAAVSAVLPLPAAPVAAAAAGSFIGIDPGSAAGDRSVIALRSSAGGYLVPQEFSEAIRREITALETRQFSVEGISYIFDIPPALLTGR